MPCKRFAAGEPPGGARRVVGVEGVGIPVDIDPGSAAMVKSKVIEVTIRRFAMRSCVPHYGYFRFAAKELKGVRSIYK